MRSGLVILSAAASLGAGAIHLALGPHHVEELGVIGLGFYAAGGLQLALAASLVLWREGPARALRAIILTGVGLHAAILAAWSFSRVVGLPAGPVPWRPEAVGLSDAVSAALEILAVASAVLLLRTAAAPPGRQPAMRDTRGTMTAAPAVVLVALATGFVLFSPDGVAGHGTAAGHGHSHGFGHAHPDRPADAHSHAAPAATAGPPAAASPAPTAMPVAEPRAGSDPVPSDHEPDVTDESEPHGH